MRTISFDGVIVGGGGAGMRAALQLAQSGYKTAVISKVFLLALIQFQRKEASPVQLQVPIRRTTGVGICMTP